MAYRPNFTWTVADADKVQIMARAGYAANHIATILGRSTDDVLRFCQDNGIFVRTGARASR